MDISQALLSTMLIHIAYHNQWLQQIHTMDWNLNCGTIQSRVNQQQRGRWRTETPQYHVDATLNDDDVIQYTV